MTWEARAAFSAEERRSLWGMGGFILLLHLVGWGVLIGIVAPHHYALGGQLMGVGLGVTAYTLGMRHAFDADHIAAIDNTTRKLMSEGKRPLSVGFWFSLGHSTVVFVTVTEVGLLVVAGGAAAANLPWWAILTLPILFAAGMSLLDTIDGSFMN